MTTGILDEHHFNNQCSLYESTRTRSQTVPLHRQTTTTTLFETESTPSVNNNRRVKYSTQTSVPSSHITSNSIHKRHSSSTDILSLIRSFALKPFRTSSMTNGITAGQTNNVISDTNVHIKPPVSLLRFRPLSDNVTSHASYAQSTRSCEDFLKRMGWPVNSTTDEARVKWNTAMKFLFPSKFDVNRAISLYRRHEDVRKNENLDHIWFNNPHLTREIQSSKFFALPQLQNQPLTVCFTAANMINVASTNSLSEKDRELVTLQALICQLDVATESMDVQQNGLNFIYDMQNCSASQFDMNLTKKILKLLQGGYPAMLKNLFIISAPKWFRVGYKVTMYTPDQIRECLTTQYGYSLDDIPISFGGLFDPILEGDTRCEKCLLTVRNPQSICYPYYSPDCQPITTKSSRNILFLSADHQDRKKSNVSTSTTTNSQASLVAIVALRRHHDSSSQIRVRKRESSTSSSDSEKRRRRSNDSLIEEEPRVINSLTFIPTEISTDQSQQKISPLSNDYSSRALTVQQEKSDYETKSNMSENENREHGVLKRDTKRTTNNLYRLFSETEFLAKASPEMRQEIRQEFRKLPNPQAKDAYAAKEEKNLDKSRYRDVIPGEATRVKLQPDGDDKHDFINANYVSGYNNQEKAYIFTQGPLQTTVKDFWRMVWQENISVIVMTTKIRESGTVKCFPYWPMESNESFNAGLYQIQNEDSKNFDSFIITKLILTKKNHSDIRTIYHAHYLKWPDHGIPSNTKDALLFLKEVELRRQLTKSKAPVLLHCSAGIGRTGTFCAIDIGIKRYLDKKTIDIPSTVLKMRTERAGSVQTEDQYLFAHLALMDFIKQRQQAIQERMNETHTSDGTKLKDNNSLSEVDDNVRKTSRTKSNGKKSNEYEQSNLQVPIVHRTKTLSDSSISAVQYLTPSTTNPQTEPSRQRSSTEHISSMSTNNVHHKKARK